MAVIARLLDKDPDRRYQSARELIFALSNYAANDDDGPIISERDATIVRPPPRGSVRSLPAAAGADAGS